MNLKTAIILQAKEEDVPSLAARGFEPESTGFVKTVHARSYSYFILLITIPTVIFAIMRSATVHELKQELLNMPANELTDLCLRLAKYKKENKELLTYLIFESHDEQGYVQTLKKEIDEEFAQINQSNLYYVKKTLRKILRIINKHIRYTGSSQATVELLIYFCRSIKDTGIPIQKNPIIANLYKGQLQKINKTLLSLHEDLQYDYSRSIVALEI